MTAVEPTEPASTDAEHEEVKALLGPDVRTPVGIPKKYRPAETSTHELFKVELEDFAGPLDLLLFLIRQHDLDIFDIPISFITERYLAMLDAMKDLSIDLAGEFLVLAAELTHIKSKMLLPPKEGIAVEAEAEDEGDPRAELVRRLLEYQKYRDAANELQDFDQLGRDVFARIPPPGGTPDDFDPGLRDTSIFRLVEAMSDVLARLEPEVHHEISTDWVNVTDRIRFIYAHAEAVGERFTFRSLFRRTDGRRMVVVTFLAILELARLKVLRIEQDPEEGSEPLPPVAAAELPLEATEPPLEETESVVESELEADPLAGELPEPRAKLAYELPSLEAPKPSEIWLRITGPMPLEATGFDAPPVAEAAFEEGAEEPLDEDDADPDPDLTSPPSNP